MMTKRLMVAGLTVVSLALAGSAQAAPFTLTFEGLADLEQILDYYGGGAGPDHGVVFDDAAIAAIDSDNGGSGDFANEPSPNTAGLFLTETQTIADVDPGFDTGLLFYYTYSDFLAPGPASVSIWDGPGGTGTQLASVGLSSNFQDDRCTGDPTGTFCHWDLVALPFLGIARSVVFAGTPERLGFDNITFGAAAAPSAVPEPASIVLLASGFAGLIAARRKRQNIR